MKKKYDVIIIGAGIGGLECARQLTFSSFKILILEKQAVIGNSICAGGLSGVFPKLDFPKKIVNIYNNWTIIGKSAEKRIIDLELRTISRQDLAQYQLEFISNNPNIDIKTNTEVFQIKKNKIITNKGEINFDYLVGADGSKSIVRKYLGLKSKFNVGAYYNINKINNEVIWDIGNIDKGYYIRIFPHKNFENIGIFFDPNKINFMESKKILENFIKKYGYDIKNKQIRKAPISYHYEGCIFNNIYLIGDAAGLALKTTGEGNSLAFISGEEIGKKLLYPNYNMSKLKELLKFKEDEEKNKKVFKYFNTFKQ